MIEVLQTIPDTAWNLVGNFLLFAFFAGRVTQVLKDHGRRIGSLEEFRDRSISKVGRLEGRWRLEK